MHQLQHIVKNVHILLEDIQMTNMALLLYHQTIDGLSHELKLEQQAPMLYEMEILYQQARKEDSTSKRDAEGC